MPFTKVKKGKNKGKYKSPSGRVYTARQVRYYYASDGFSRPPRKRKRKSRGKTKRRTPTKRKRKKNKR